MASSKTVEGRAQELREQLLLGVTPRKHGLGGVAHRGEDDPTRVDDGAVEVEEHNRVAHALDRSHHRRRDSGRVEDVALCNPGLTRVTNHAQASP